MDRSYSMHKRNAKCITYFVRENMKGDTTRDTKLRSEDNIKMGRHLYKVSKLRIYGAIPSLLHTSSWQDA
jgi:hypothetical protein